MIHQLYIALTAFEGVLGLFWGVFSTVFHFKVSKIALISHSLPNVFRHKLINFIGWVFFQNVIP